MINPAIPAEQRLPLQSEEGKYLPGGSNCTAHPRLNPLPSDNSLGSLELGSSETNHFGKVGILLL